MLYKVISSAILLLALMQGVASSPSLSARLVKCGPGVRVKIIAVDLAAWPRSPTCVVLFERARESAGDSNDGSANSVPILICQPPVSKYGDTPPFSKNTPGLS
ncbi:hypothetical protein GGX14DRAFT_400718 [Mycena pura]|uniref:Secreted protein n=1 Tax=Mycena pura TaxID=153505 RepID=A0AAD6V485_9AGAR|nr:hypothetical protein GGX14DRAFT_400718 [Mycena pura]